MAQLNIKGLDDALYLRLKSYIGGVKGMTFVKVFEEAVREYLDRRRGSA